MKKSMFKFSIAFLVLAVLATISTPSKASSDLVVRDYYRGLEIGYLDANIFWDENTQEVSCVGNEVTVGNILAGNGGTQFITNQLGPTAGVCLSKTSLFNSNYDAKIMLLDFRIATNVGFEKRYWEGLKEAFILRVCELGLQYSIAVACS